MEDPGQMLCSVNEVSELEAVDGEEHRWMGSLLRVSAFSNTCDCLLLQLNIVSVRLELLCDEAGEGSGYRIDRAFCTNLDAMLYTEVS